MADEKEVKSDKMADEKEVISAKTADEKEVISAKTAEVKQVNYANITTEEAMKTGVYEYVKELAIGRRHFAVGDYSAAAEAFAIGCEILAKRHGDTGDLLAEPYLWYGKALLGLSREESGVLGDGVPGTNAEEDEDDNEDHEENEENDESEQVEAEESSDKQNVDSKEAEESEAESTKKEEEAGSSTAPESTEAQPGPSNGDANESTVDMDGEDEIDNLQHAWEILDLARSILMRREGSDTCPIVRTFLADVHLTLGEVALESETYDKAIVDMQTCLQIQKDLFCAFDRRIAETHYKLGLANSLASNFEDAITHFKNAANIIQSRIAALENPREDDETILKNHMRFDPGYTMAGEIKELKELLPEVQEKIQDMMDYKAETIKRVRETLCPSNGESSSLSNGSAEPKPVASDISHLVKRKRKSSEGEGSAPKRSNK